MADPDPAEIAQSPEWLTNQIAHALRSPIFAALVQADAVAMRCSAMPEVQKSLGSLVRQLRRLESTINEMLLFGRPPRLKLREVNVAELAEAVAADYRSGKGGDPSEVTVEVADKGLTATWDPDAVRLVLERLLDNAVQHTKPPHRVVLRVQAAGDEVQIAVKDDGEGIPAEIRTQAFLPFFPQHRGRPGLGLAVANKLVHHLGGRILLASEPEAGTEVTVVLPRVTTDPGAA